MPSNPKFRISWEALSYFRISFSWSRGRSTHSHLGQIIYSLPHHAVGSGGRESGYPHACLSSGRGNPDAHIGAAEGTTLTSLQPLTLGWASLLFLGDNFPGLWLSLWEGFLLLASSLATGENGISECALLEGAFLSLLPAGWVVFSPRPCNSLGSLVGFFLSDSQSVPCAHWHTLNYLF